MAVAIGLVKFSADVVRGPGNIKPCLNPLGAKGGTKMLKRKFKLSVALVSGLVLLGSSLLMAIPQNAANTQDESITTSIQAKLFQDPSLKTQDIQVTTEDGVVTLSGTVDSQQQRDAVDRIASMEPGVKKVIDGLSVNEQAERTPASVQYSQPAPSSAPPSSGNQSQPFGNSSSQVQPLPSSLQLQPGTMVSVRISQALSSDHNQVGDGFTAVLEQPVVVDGWVVARRGQTLQGRVDVVKKGGRIKGTSELGISLTDLTLVNGNQLPIRTRLLDASAGASKGRDAAAVGTTTGIGAVIGAIAGEGEGAGIGAAAGAAAGVAGVLLTRGRPTVIAPETLLTFRLEAPANISTIPGQAAFRPVTQQDYAQNGLERRPERIYTNRPPYGPPVYWGYYGWPGYYPSYWGWYYGGPYWRYYRPGFGGIYRFRGEWRGDRGEHRDRGRGGRRD